MEKYRPLYLIYQGTWEIPKWLHWLDKQLVILTADAYLLDKTKIISNRSQSFIVFQDISISLFDIRRLNISFQMYPPRTNYLYYFCLLFSVFSSISFFSIYEDKMALNRILQTSDTRFNMPMPYQTDTAGVRSVGGQTQVIFSSS